MVLGSVLVLFYHMYLSIFPAPVIEESVFSPLYIPASFVNNKMPKGAWV